MEPDDWYPEAMLRFTRWTESIQRSVEARGWNGLVRSPTARKPKNDGFTVPISEAHSFKVQLKEATEFLKDHADFIAELMQHPGQEASVDFTIVGSKDAAHSSIYFELDFLELLLTLRISLGAGVYW